MRLTSTLAVAAAFGLTVTGPSFAQSVETGQEVRIGAIPPRSGGVLLYPGGEYARTVPSLLYPGERSGPIQLHMPSPRRHVAARTAAPETAPLTPAPPRPARPRRVAKVEPAPAAAPAPVRAPVRTPSPSENPFGGAANLGNVFASAAPPAPQPQIKTAPAGPVTGNENLTKRSVILFAKDAPDPAKGALGAIKFLASDLNAAMSGPGARVELQAFGGNKGDKGSDARRLSLKRALAIRQVLIDDGVAPDRIDVRAMGGADDSGPADRVDVYVKA